MNKEFPSLSVIIPCRNEEKYIGLCLDSIIQSDYPKESLSVFVCDGLSDDTTVEIIKDYAKKHGYIQLVVNERKTTPFALNIGIKASTSDYATILGAHAEVSKSYFSKSVKDFQIDPKMGCTGGFLINEYEDEVSEAIGSAQSSSFGVGNAHFRTGNASGFVDTVAFGTYSRKVFEKIGYFDEELDRNQDDEFNFRLLKNGFKIYLDKDITANYYVRGSFKKLYRQYWQYGYWKVFVNVKHQMITTVRQLIPMLFVLFLAVGAVLSFVHPILRLLFFAGLGSYLLGAVFFATKKSKTPLQSAKIIFSFLILHLSYGLGYLKGIWDFMVLRKGPSKSSASLTR